VIVVVSCVKPARMRASIICVTGFSDVSARFLVRSFLKRTLPKTSQFARNTSL